MRVSDVIRILTDEYDPDDEIIIEWWSKTLFDSVFSERPDRHEGEFIPDEVWGDAVMSVENGEFGWQDWAFESMYSEVEESWERYIREGE
jgi:hypothetical protein